jgi:16S rRNA (uracil1498-N3)-methyltransferase
MPRFYVDLPLAPKETFELPAGVAHHAVAVLRLRPGEPVTLFNGRGGEYRARLVDCSVKSARAEILGFDAREAELPFRVTIAQGLPAADKMDWAVEKAVELGAAALQPLATTRSVVRLAGERATRRRGHWQAIAQAAAEQCGRNRVPQIHELATLEAWLACLPEGGVRLWACPRSSQFLTAMAAPEPDTPVHLVIGPEAGLSDTEEAALRDAGFQAVSLGERILRTETAALAALAMLSAVWGAAAQS